MTAQFKNQKSKVFNTFYFLLVLLTFNFLLLTLPSSVYAQVSTPSADPSTVYRLPSTVSPTSPLYTDLLLNNMFHSFSCLAIGSSVIGQPCLTYQVTKNAQGAIQSVPMLSSVNLSGGTLGAVSSLIGALYLNPPVRTADYLASVGQGLGIAKEARAQGVTGSGANVLSPIIKLWQVSRNVSYVIMIIIFVVIGLMVMFRQKINPQTVITAQAALPGLVIGLILITFSYFLAGLISDVAFIGTNVVGYYFSAAQGSTNTTTKCHDPSNLVECTKNENTLSVFAPFTKVISYSRIRSALESIWKDLDDPGATIDPQLVLKGLTGLLVAQLIMPFGSMAGGWGQALAGAVSLGGAWFFPQQIISIGLAFIAILILIYTMFKLLLRLINNFLTIIFLTVTAPFHFLAASLPGRQSMATDWVRNMLCNVLAFPAVIAILYFVAFLLDYTQAVFPVTESTAITGTSTFPLFGGMSLDFIKIMLAFGALVATPSVPDIICRTIGKPSQAGQLLGQELRGNIGAGQGYATRTQQGLTGFAGQVGRLTDEPHYYISGLDENGKPIYKIDPKLSRTGLIGRWRARLTGAKSETIK